MVTITPEQQLSTGFMFFVEAESYLKAARSLSTPYLGTPFEVLTAIIEKDWIKIYRPTANIYCHAIELYLKGFLLSTGSKLSELERRPYSHNILNCMNEGISRGLSLEQDTIENIAFLNDDYSSYRFRYPAPGKMTIGNPVGLDSTCADLRKAVYPSINRKVQARGRP
jgi:hypothetical protein